MSMYEDPDEMPHYALFEKITKSSATDSGYILTRKF